MIRTVGFPWIPPDLIARKWVVLGTGGHARVVLSALAGTGIEVMGAVGPLPPPGKQPTLPILGDDEWLVSQGADDYFVINGVGANPDIAIRRALFERYRSRGFRFPPMAHPQAMIANGVMIGEAVQVMMGAIVQEGASLGENAVINTGAIVEHDVQVGSHVFIAPGATVCGGVEIGTSAFLGAGCVVLPGISIGPGAVVAAGAILTHPISAGEKVAGCPARPITVR